MNDWLYCEDCDKEFMVVTDSHDKPNHCPFCTNPLEIDEPEESDEWN